MAFQQYPSKGGIPGGDTAARPAGAALGDTFYNGTLGLLEIYDGTNWVPCSSPAGIPTVSVSDVGTSRAYTSGAIVFTFVAGTTGGNPYGFTANASLSGAAYASTATSSVITLSVGGPGSYTYAGTAYNGFGTSPSSPSANISVTTVPQAPTIGTATATTGIPNEIAVTWTNGNNGGKNLSAITITPYLNGTTAQTSRTAATTSSTTYTFTEGQLTAGSAYTFKVTATNANGTSLDSTASNSATMPGFFAADFLVLAGGGGGTTGYPTPNNRAAGAGGAGGFRSSISPTGGGASAESTLTLNSAVNYTVTIGAGGAGGEGGVGSGNLGVNGNNSTFNTITSTGGGRGAAPSAANAGASGGSGGGGSNAGGAGGAGTSGQGYAGGTSAGGNAGASGGGAGGVGDTADSTTPPNNGVNNSITGSSVTYAKGGPYSSATDGPAGPANTGQGGAGGYDQSTVGKAGGSGVVIIRYPDTKTITIGAGLTGSESAASGGYKRATITAGSGNVSWA
jgi:hypothetical protein